MISRARPAPDAPARVRHVAIIMDGNRRWARERNLPSIEGHRVGARVLREVAQSAGRLGIEILTVFAFSEENWKRAPSEVALLMALMADFASSERDALAEAGIRVRVIGRADRLPDSTARALDGLVAATAGNTGVLLNLAIDYGARTELSDAMRALATDVRNGRLALEAIDDDTLSRYLYTAGLPDPDLLIRTGGELRLSNFLLYQIAYTELWSTPNHWPSFDAHALADAVGAFANRQRRFGS